LAAVLDDACGLAVSTDSRNAVDAYDRGIRALLGFGADTVDSFRAPVDADPAFALARAGLGEPERAQALLARRLAARPNPGHYWAAVDQRGAARAHEGEAPA
jgi:hypothetical protein